MFHFKRIKAGGFGPLRRMMAIAEAAGVPYMIGQMDEADAGHGRSHPRRRRVFR